MTPSMGVTPEGKKFFVGKFTKNSGEMRSDRIKKVWGDTLEGVTPE